MLQQIIALIIIGFFIIRLLRQKKKKQLSGNEFILWLFFWLIAALAIIFIKQIDRTVAWLGFSGSGINFLIYLAVLVLFYLIFRLRLNIAKMDKGLTELTRLITLKEKK
ncbi:MAG: DUF2304 domain-containing protein [Patescibacteria group bacterium]|jgi:hypothetical protein